LLQFQNTVADHRVAAVGIRRREGQRTGPGLGQAIAARKHGTQAHDLIGRQGIDAEGRGDACECQPAARAGA